MIGLRAFRSGPGGGIERPVVLAADVENNAYPNFILIAGPIAGRVACRTKNCERKRGNGERRTDYKLHSFITSLINNGGSAGD